MRMLPLFLVAVLFVAGCGGSADQSLGAVVSCKTSVGASIIVTDQAHVVMVSGNATNDVQPGDELMLHNDADKPYVYTTRKPGTRWKVTKFSSE